MSITEIKEAIAKLPPEQRRELVRALSREKVQLSQEERLRIQSKADALPDDLWVNWEDLKVELSQS